MVHANNSRNTKNIYIYLNKQLGKKDQQADRGKDGLAILLRTKSMIVRRFFKNNKSIIQKN